MNARRLRRVRLTYRLFAPAYDPFRRVWSRWTPSSEAALDELFRERIPPSARVLELGPGTGVNIERLRRLGIAFERYVGIDASAEMLARCRAKTRDDPRIELRLGDVGDLSDVPERFHFVVSTWVLSHLEDPVAAVRGALSLLEPGGTAVFLCSGVPRSRLARACLAPFYRAAGARFVDADALRALPGAERVELASGGLAVLAVFRAARG